MGISRLIPGYGTDHVTFGFDRNPAWVISPILLWEKAHFESGSCSLWWFSPICEHSQQPAPQAFTNFV